MNFADGQYIVFNQFLFKIIKYRYNNEKFKGNGCNVPEQVDAFIKIFSILILIVHRFCSIRGNKRVSTTEEH